MATTSERVALISASHLRPLFEKVGTILNEQIKASGKEPSDGQIVEVFERVFYTSRLERNLSLSKLSDKDFIVIPKLVDEENLIVLTYRPLEGLKNDKIMVHYSGVYPEGYDLPIAEDEIGGEFTYQVIDENPDDMSQTKFVTYTNQAALDEINRQLSQIKHTEVLYCYINLIRLAKSASAVAAEQSDQPQLENNGE